MKGGGATIRSRSTSQGVRSGAESQRTIDECVDDELAILLHQVVDVPENSAVDKLILLASLPSFQELNTPLLSSQGQQKTAEGGVGLGVVRTTS
jgi:hypothetical protein